MIKGSALALCAALAPATVSADGHYDGVVIDILTRPGPVIAGRIVERGEEFKAMTGAEIRVAEVPFAELFQKILTDWATGTNSIDVGVFASGWGVELVSGGLVENLDPYLEADDKIDLADIAPYFRDFNQKVQGSTYFITLDGDFQMLYYRTDVLADNGLEPPKTWEEYLEVAAAIHGQDMNGDGEADYGSCIFKKRNAQSYFAVQSMAASRVQTKGTAEGLYFDPETMKPKINNAAWRKAFELYKATGEFGPADELNQDIGDTRALVTGGRCGLAIDWGDIGPLSIEEGSEIRDKIGAVIMPGSAEALDVSTGELAPCDANLCPHAVDGINYAPFAAFGGWTAAISATAEDTTKQAAYDFLSYMNQAAQSNVDVTMGWTGYNPYRNSQLENTAAWVEAGFSQEAAENYLSAIKQSLNHPNMASDFRIPGAQQYTGVVLDRELARYLADEITVDQALANIEEGWEEITDDFGREEQAAIYALSLGISN
ncbi:ABC transporter substrate-binding protein [Tateyamaria sp. SN3-11]|uniref:ABC transporter substrate-binding protein n=1 Tax=Tateyamaria sp. SN3-11 TaxID=3092147 RepID=UPI0039EA6FCE